MKKFILLLSCSLIASTVAKAQIQSNRLTAVKNLFSQEFDEMDADSNGVITAEEYMRYQLESLQKSLMAENMPKEEQPLIKKEDKEASKPDSLSTLNKTMATLQEMADFELDTENATTATDEEWYLKPAKLTKEDVMPKDNEEQLPELDLSISEEESLNNILNENKVASKSVESTTATSLVKEAIEETPQKEEKLPDLASILETKAEPTTPTITSETQATTAPATLEEELEADFLAEPTLAPTEDTNAKMQLVVETLQKSLPQKIDSITTWIDVKYQNNAIDYIYQADVSTDKFSLAEKKALKENIEKVACVQAYTQMCPHIKTMFIDNGVNVKIRYYDKSNLEISFCEFNNETCK